MSDWATLLQWTGWASFGSIVVALLTLWLKDRADRRTLSVEREKLVISARGVDVTATEATIHARLAEATVQGMANETYQGLITALKERIDDLDERLTEEEGREQQCLKRVELLEEEQGRLQAALWKLRNHKNE